MATAALRAGLVVAALALGFFVLSKAFPSGGGADVPSTPAGETTITASPTEPADTGGGEQPGGNQGDGGNGTGGEARPPGRVQLQVLNGTDIAGLASDTQTVLEEAGYRVLSIGDAQSKPYEVTVISYLKAARADAEALREQFFPGAELEQAAPNAQVEVTVIVGEDYAAQQGEETG